MFQLGKIVRTAFRANFSRGSSLTVAVPSFSFPSSLSCFIQKSNFSSLFNRCPTTRSILTPAAPVLTNHVAGLKVKYALRRRCKDCYMIVRNQRTYIMCPTHPRHKQMQPIKKPKYTWTLTGASQSKVRPW